MRENKIIKNISIAIISILIIVIIGLGVYTVFIKKDDNVKNGNYLFTKLEKYELSVNNKVVSIDGKNVKVRKDNEDAFYINDTKILDAWSGDSIYVSDYFIIHIGNAMAGEMYRIFNANGTEININNDGVFEKIYLENGKLVGVTPKDYECINGEEFPCEEPYKVEFIYDGTSITIDKLNNNADLPMIELAIFYEFKDNNKERKDTFFVTTDGDVYLFSTYEDYYGYNELDVKEYNIKNVGSYRNNKTFSGIKLNLSNIKKIYNVEVGNGGVHYFAFLTSDNRLYFTNDYSLNLFTSDELIDIVNVVDEEKCSTDGICAMWAYAINDKNEKIDLYNIEKKLTEE